MVRTWLRRLRGRKAKARPPRPVSTPTILQMEAVECGAACLAIVLAHHGRRVPLDELRTVCGVSRDGSKASNLVRAARRYGLLSKGFKREPGQLVKLRPPMILHWNFNHFVVLNGFRRGKAFLNDPSTGPRKVNLEELDQAFTGIVLLFERGPEFSPGGRSASLLRALVRRLSDGKAAVLFITLCGVALAITQLMIPVYSKIFVDRILIDGHLPWLKPLLLAMACTGLVVAGLSWLQQSILLRLETKLSLSGAGSFFWHILRLPVDFFVHRYSGEIGGRVALNDRVAQLVSRQLATTVLSSLLVLSFILLMVQYDPLLTLVGCVTVGLDVVFLRLVARRRIDGSRRLQLERGKLHGVLVAGLRMIETAKAMANEEDLFARWAGHNTKVVNDRQRLDFYTQLLDVVPSLFASLNAVLVLGLGSLQVMRGNLSIGELVAFQVLMVFFVAPAGRLVGLGDEMQTIQGDLARLEDVLRCRPVLPSSIARPPDAKSEPKLEGELELRDIRFGYCVLDPPLIEGFDLALNPGRRVALVGASGSGKSTIAKIAVGLVEPWEGEVLLDDTPISEICRARLAHSVAWVDQRISLFAGTIRDNLTLWDDTVPFADLVAAARDAEFHEDVLARPGGYEGEIEERGTDLSGGQRQRLEIARALVNNPSLLVLDEATSSLDPTTEARIDRNLLRRGCSCLIVAHRLSTVRDADEILVLDEGRIIERGTHGELIAKGGAYAELMRDS